MQVMKINRLLWYVICVQMRVKIKIEKRLGMLLNICQTKCIVNGSEEWK